MFTYIKKGTYIKHVWQTEKAEYSQIYLNKLLNAFLT